MSKSNARLLTSLVLATLLGATILTVTPADAFPVSAGQKSLVEAQFGPGAPYTAWEPRATTNTFYLHSDPTGTSPVRYTNGNALVGAMLDVNAPTRAANFATVPYPLAATQVPALDNGNQVYIGKTGAGANVVARFPMADDLRAVDSFRVSGFSTTVWAGCVLANPTNAAATALTIRSRLIAQQDDDGDGVWQDRAVIASADLLFTGTSTGAGGATIPAGSTSLPGQINRASRSVTVGDLSREDAPLVRAGERLTVEYALIAAVTVSGVQASDASCILFYDGTYLSQGNPRYSFVTVTSDAMRAAVFTATTSGQEALGYPSAANTDASGRRVIVEALQAHALGPGMSAQLMSKHAHVRLYDLGTQQYLYYRDNTDSSFPYEFDVQTLRLVSSRADQLNPEPDLEQHMGNGILRRSYVFSYEATQPEVPRIQAQFYSYSDSWVVNSKNFAIGGKGITFGLLPGEQSTHDILAGEPTVFSFLIRNTGTANDVVSVSAADASGGWTATVKGGGQYFVPAGSLAIGLVEIVPPANAVAGASRTVTLRASSSFSDVPDPSPLVLRVNVVSTLVSGVDISSIETSLDVRPGVAKSLAVTVANTGNSRTSVVVLPQIPSNLQGWGITTTPSSLQLLAGERSQVQVQVLAPADAASGSSFGLGLSATQVGNAAVTDRLDVVIRVLALEGLTATVFQGPIHNLREKGPECRDSLIQDVDQFGIYSDAAHCFVGRESGASVSGGGRIVPDGEFDDSALFRIVVENLGDATDRYKVTGFWDTEPGPAGLSDENGCDGDPSGTGNEGPDGIPDGWRYNWGSAVGTGMPASRQLGTFQRQGIGFSGIYTLNGTDNPLVIGPRSTGIQFLEIGHLDIACSEIYGPLTLEGNPVEDALLGDYKRVRAGSSGVAQFIVQIQSLNDPTRVIQLPAQVVVTSAGTRLTNTAFTGAQHSYILESARGAATSATTSVGSAASFDLVAVNTGNEKDGVKISLSKRDGWTHQVNVTKKIPGAATCAAPATDGSVTCTGLGVYDEVHFRVTARPSATVPIGDRNQITVTVQSTDAPGITQSLLLTARAAGTFDFAFQALGNTTRGVAPTGSVSFPVSIRNDGTADDSYRLTLLSGNVGAWRAVLSTSAPLFVPSGSTVNAFLTVTTPAGSAVGATEIFRLQVESVNSEAKKTLEVSPVVQAASSLVVVGKDGQDLLVPQRGVATPVTVRGILTSGSAPQMTFRVDSASLPAGWTVDRTSQTVSTSTVAGLSTAEATFQVTAPAGALGTSRAILPVRAEVGVQRASTDIALHLASTFGLNLTVESAKQVVPPGGAAVFNVTLKNLGLGQDTVSLTNSQMPQGWTLLFNPPTLTLGPLETREVLVTLRAPATAQPGNQASILMFASSRGDATQVTSIPLVAEVGFHRIVAQATSTAVQAAAPQETVTFVVNVTNNGTLPDEVSAAAVLDTIPQRDNVVLAATPARFNLDPGQTAQVQVQATYGAAIPSDISLQSTLRLESLLDARPEASRAKADVVLQSRVLPYRSADPNGDGLADYAVDRNGDASDGFESFRASTTPGGRPLVSADLVRFLRDDAREGFSRDVVLENGTTVRLVVLTIDGDKDGLVDHFLDGDGDGLPDFYWDPDANKATRIEFRKDVNGDQVPELFVDTNGDGRLDAAYDLTRGTFIPVLQVDVDGDGQLDYVVDKNGNGQVDQDETVLYTRTGRLLIVQKVDVDGDGRLDQVFDVDGDGNPDYFIPAGSRGSVPIVLRDVNGDGVADWTFDGNNDGRRESYYDPVTGKAHVIDASGHFLDALAKYWYVGALFGAVVVLFVALVLVTRK
jgi:uncharacterized membrane protein